MIVPSEAACAYAASGYAIIRGLLAPPDLAPLADAVEAVYRQWLKRNPDACAAQRLINMHSLTLPDYFLDAPSDRLRFFDLLLPLDLTRFLDAMFGPGLYFHNTQLFFNPVDKDQAPYWHRDLQFSPVPDAEQAAALDRMLSLHVRIPLLPERGVALVPGTHRRWDTPFEAKVRFARDGQRNSDALPGEVLIDLEPGDVLVFHSQMIHRGHYAANSARKALDLCVAKAHPLTARWLDPLVLPDEGDIGQIRNSAWYRRGREIAAAFPRYSTS